MKLIEAYQEQQLKDIQNLYEKAFPASEKKPFSLILEKRKEGVVEVLAIEGEERFLGLAISILYKDMVLLDYFAVAANKRGKGVGSAAIQLLKERYANKRFFLEIERTDIEAENLEERCRRREFYLKNGLMPISLFVELFKVEMEVLTNHCKVNFEEYYQLYIETFGKGRIEGNVKLGK